MGADSEDVLLGFFFVVAVSALEVLSILVLVVGFCRDHPYPCSDDCAALFSVEFVHVLRSLGFFVLFHF